MEARHFSRQVVFAMLLAVSLAAGCSKTLTDPKEVEKSPQAQAYRAYVKAIQDGNWLDMMRSVTSDVSDRLQMLGGSEQHLAMFREGLASDIRFVKLHVEGSKAVLSATGKAQGAPAKCEIQMRKQGNLWRVEKDEWIPTGQVVLPM
ncbi:MAG TPA: hypothetical protein VKH43_12515 [Thermoanaerobaculia bacterium]|nr:hypothetical protein [Thermoanaerobaculia bacterium]